MNNKPLKGIATIFAMIIASHLSTLLVSWIMIIPITAIISIIFKLSIPKSILYGFLSVLIVWTFLILFDNLENSGILIDRIGDLFGGINNFVLILVTSLIGGILGASGGWIGGAINNFLYKLN